MFKNFVLENPHLVVTSGRSIGLVLTKQVRTMLLAAEDVVILSVSAGVAWCMWKYTG